VVSVTRGRVRIEGGEISENAGAGVAVRRARAVLRGCRVRANAVALRVSAGSVVEVSGCDLTGNREEGGIDPGGRLVVLPGRPSGEGRE
jgi:hypothetical protein